MITLRLIAASWLPTQQLERYAWIVRNGADTVSVEHVTREASQLRAEVLVTGRARLNVVAATSTEGCVTGAEVRVFPWGSAPDATPLQQVEVRLDGDSARVAVQARDVSRTLAISAHGARFVLAGDSYAASALVVDCALASGVDSVDVPVVAFPNLRTALVGVRRHGDTVTVVMGDTSYVQLDPSGRPVHVQIGGDVVLERVAPDSARAEAEGPDYSAPPGAAYTAEDVVVPVEPGVVLAGTLTLPGDLSDPVPAVVTVSGSGPQDRDGFVDIAEGWRPFRQLADALGARGIAVLRFDDRGVGRSTGDFGSSTELTAAADVEGAIAYLRARPEVDATRIAVLGHSEGSRVAMIVGARDASLAGLVLLSGAADPRAAVRAQALWVAEHDPSLTGFSRDSLLALVDRQWDSLATTSAREVYRWDAVALARRIHMPVAVFQGATDRQVPADQADSLGAIFRRTGNTDVTVRVFPDVNHLLVHDTNGDFLAYYELPNAKVAEEVLSAIAGWLTVRFGRRKTGSGERHCSVWVCHPISRSHPDRSCLS
jgi:alpha-beta hydrolase superfamily lysophospholipase